MRTLFLLLVGGLLLLGAGWGFARWRIPLPKVTRQWLHENSYRREGDEP